MTESYIKTQLRVRLFLYAKTVGEPITHEQISRILEKLDDVDALAILKSKCANPYEVMMQILKLRSFTLAKELLDDIERKEHRQLEPTIEEPIAETKLEPVEKPLTESEQDKIIEESFEQYKKEQEIKDRIARALVLLDRYEKGTLLTEIIKPKPKTEAEIEADKQYIREQQKKWKKKYGKSD
jgi:hypothetical protein